MKRKRSVQHLIKPMAIRLSEVVVDRDFWDNVLNHVACTPEEALWGAVLQQGVVSALRPEKFGSEDDWSWIFESTLDERHVGSFLFCCEAIGIDPIRLRNLVMVMWMKGRRPRNLSGGTGFLSVQV